jgi:hypothetical protein
MASSRVGGVVANDLIHDVESHNIGRFDHWSALVRDDPCYPAFALMAIPAAFAFEMILTRGLLLKVFAIKVSRACCGCRRVDECWGFVLRVPKQLDAHRSPNTRRLLAQEELCLSSGVLEVCCMLLGTV